MDLAADPHPPIAPWPSSTAMVERLRDVPAARALRVRFAAIQELLQLFPGVRALEHSAYLCVLSCLVS